MVTLHSGTFVVVVELVADGVTVVVEGLAVVVVGITVVVDTDGVIVGTLQLSGTKRKINMFTIFKKSRLGPSFAYIFLW